MRPLHRRLDALAGAAACLLAVALLVIGACVSERQKAGGPTGTVEGDCNIPVGSPIIGSTQALVAIRNFSFNPDTVHIKRGTTVTWVNCENVGIDAHTSTSDTQRWQSPFLSPGATYSHTFD